MQKTQQTHPLMPGIRCPEINHPDWPRTLHDKQLTGFSPLTLGMAQAPTPWQTIAVPGTYQWIKTVDTPTGPGFLIDDGRLALYQAENGQCRWQAPLTGQLVFWGDLYGSGEPVALLRQANRLMVVDGDTGTLRWSQTYQPPHVDLRVQVAAILPHTAGLQAAVFEQYGDHGWLLAFEPHGAVRQIWRRQVIANDTWPVRADHGCDIAFDLDAPTPIIWNVRHHRCQSFNALTGAPLGVLQYNLDGGHRRNYGPWRIATGPDQQRFIVVASEMVQTHLHGIRLHPDGIPELAWQRYYGEVYVVPGVAVEFLGVGDMDGDGTDEIAYNVRDPQDNFRSFVRIRCVATGAVKYQLANQWCSALAKDLGAHQRTVLLTHPAPDGATPQQGPLTLTSFHAGTTETLATFAHGGPWGLTTVLGPTGQDLLLRLIDPQGVAVVRLNGTTLYQTERITQGPVVAAPPNACAQIGPHLHLASAAGTGRWPNGTFTPFKLRGGAPPTLSAADAAGTGQTALYAHIPGQRLKRWTLNGPTPHETLDTPFFGATTRHSPLLYDLDGDGQLELVVPGVTARGQLDVRALRPDGTELWHTVLPQARSDDQGQAAAWNAGQFLSTPNGSQAALALSVYSLRRTLEGTYLLEGANGRVHWFKGNYHDGQTIRAYRPVGLPGVFDWDGDGVEEMAWDMYSYMAFLRGNGDMAAIYGGPNVRPAAEAVPAIMLYNGFTPVYRTPQDARPHWLVHHGHGRFGLVGPDPRQGLWHEDEGYDTPERLGFIDIDGDGVLEVGYALRNSVTFCCRNLWTGAIKWTLELPQPPTGPVLTADVDGDGKGEFLVDRWCIGTNSAGQGQIRWTAPVSMGWAVIADFDGDGLGELACPNQGRIVFLKGEGKPSV